jgi:hypothetical protein
MHIKGLRQLVKLRGGVDCLGLSGQVKAIVLGYVEYRCRSTLAILLMNAMYSAEALASLSEAPRKKPPVQIQASVCPEYPVHPFPADLCAIIAYLPQGIQELALTGRISIQIIHRLDLNRNQVANLLTDADPDKTQAEHWNKLIRSCTEFERVVWLSLVSYHLRSATYRSDLNKLAEAVIELNPPDSRAEEEWLLWTRMVILGSSLQDISFDTRRKVLRRLFDDHPEATDWCLLEKIVKKFYWNESLAVESQRYWLEGRMRINNSDSRDGVMNLQPGIQD